MPPADPNAPNRLLSSAYVLRIRQSPARGKVLGKDKDRKPLDPPPVIQLFVRDPSDPAQNYLQSPYYWMAATLWHETEDRPPDGGHNALCGSLTSSLHRLKDMDSQGQSRDGGFFVFGDLSCKVEGKYRLKVILYETLQGQVQGLAEATTSAFEVYNAKNFPGMAESTFMSRSFGDQGVRLRIRKESRQLLKRPASSYSPNPTPQQLPQATMAGGYPHAAAYASPMHNAAYNQPYMKQEDLEESASKRQRSANTSPTGYYERGNYGTMAPSAYNTQAYAGYGPGAEGLGPSPMGMGSGIGYDSASSAANTGAYGYDAARSVLPVYGGRPADPSAGGGAYSAAAYTGGYPAASYPTSSGAYNYSTPGTTGSASGSATSRAGWSGQGSS